MEEKAIRVLLVDDDPGLRTSLADILRIKGFEAVHAETGVAALAWVEQQEIGVAVIDLRLEDMPGLEVMSGIKERSPDTECILLTGHATQETAIEALNLGAYSYYQKPFNIDQLLLSIRRAVEKKASERALAASEARLSSIFRVAPIGIGVVCERIFQQANARLCEMTGYTVEELIGQSARMLYPDDDEFERVGREKYAQISEKGVGTIETRWKRKDGGITEILLASTPLIVGDLSAGVTFTALDITERRQAEKETEQRNENLVFLNAINTAINRGESLESIYQLISKQTEHLFGSLEVTLHLVDPVRQRLVMQQLTLSPMLVKKVEKIIGRPIPRIEHDLTLDHPYRRVLESGSSEIINDNEDLEEFTAGFLQSVHMPVKMRSRIKLLIPTILKFLGYHSVLIVPLISDSQVIGTLDMGRREMFTEEDTKRMEIIAGQFTAAIKRKQAEEALRESEAHYRVLFEDSPTSLWEEDYSAVKERVERLRKKGVKDFRAYFKSHPEVVKECAGLVKILDVNKATLNIHRAGRKEELLENLTNVLRDESYEHFQEELIQIIEGKTNFAWEGLNQTLDGKPLNISLNWSVAPGHETDLSRVIVSIVDITARKRTETERLALLEIMQGVAAEKSLTELLELIHKSLAKVIYAENFFVVFHNKNTGLFEEVFAVDKYDSPMPPSRLEKSITAYVFRSNEPLLLNKAKFDELKAQGEVELIGTNPSSWLGAPIKTPSETIGVIAVQNYEQTDCYSERDREFLATIGVQVSLVIERKRIEKSLQGSESSLLAVLQSTGDGILAVGSNNEVLYANDQFGEMWSIPRAMIASNDNSVLLSYVLDQLIDPQNFLKKVQQLYKSQEVSFDTLYFKDGRVFERSSRPLMMDEKMHGRVWSFRDITIRKLAEVSLRASEERYRMLAENTTDIVWLMDMNLQFTYISPSVTRLRGYTLDELNTIPLYQHLTPESFNRIMQMYAEVLNPENLAPSGPALSRSSELEYYHKDGTTLWIDTTLTPVRDSDGTPIALLGSGRNVTERKVAENSLRASEERYRLLAENTTDVIWTMDLNLRSTYTSPSVLRLRGFSSEEAVNQPLEKALTPGSYKLILEVMEEELALEKMPGNDPYRSRTVELETIRKDNSTLWVESTMTFLRDSQGKPVEILGVTRDISARKEAEGKLRQRAEELAVLQETVLEITSQHDPASLLQAIVERAVHLLKAEGGGLYLCHPEQQEVRCVISYNLQRDFTGVVLKYGEGGGGIVAQTGQPLRVDDYRVWPGRAAVFDEDQPFRAMVSAPMIWQGQVTGVIHVLRFSSDHPFTQEDQDLLVLFANHAAIAAENTRLYQEAVLAAERRSILHRASQEITAAGLDLESVYASIHRAASELMQFDVIFISQLDREHQELESVYAFDSGEKFSNIRTPVGEGVTGQVVLERASLCILDYHKQKRRKLAPFGKGDARSILAVPMFTGAEIAGVISVQSYLPGQYNQADQVLLEMLAFYAGAAIENARLFEQVQRRLRESESLGQASQSLTRSLEIQPLLENILAAARHAIPAAEKGTIMLQEADDTLRISAMTGYTDSNLLHQAFQPGEGFVTHVFEKQRPIRIDKAQAGYHLPHGKRIEEMAEVQSAIAAPLTVKGEKIGVISLDNTTRTSAFSDDDLRLLISFASSAAVAIHNTRLFEQTRHRADRLGVLQEVSEKLGYLLDLESIGEETIPAIEKLLGWTRGSLWLLEADGSLRMLAHRTPGLKGKARQKELQRLHTLVRHPGDGIVGWVIQAGQAVRCNNVLLDDRYVEGSANIRSELCVPLKAGEKVIGCLNFESEIENQFSEEDEQVLTTLAGEITGAIERASLFEQTRRRAEELGALAQVSAALRTTATRFEMTSVIINQLASVLRIDEAAIVTYASSTGENTIELASGRWAKMIGQRLPAGEGGCGVVAQTAQPFINANSGDEDLFGINALSHEPESVAGMPLLVQKQFLGSLWVGRRKGTVQSAPPPFTEEEIRLFGSIADMTANAFHRASLHEQAVRHSEQMVTVNEIGHQLSETLELEQVYARLNNAVINLLPDICALFICLYEERTRSITCASVQVDGVPVDVEELPVIPFDSDGNDQQFHALLTGEAIITNNLAASLGKDQLINLIGNHKHKPESALYVPMLSKGIPIGLIQVQSYSRARFGQDDVSLLSLVANTAAVIIENARLFAETQKRLHYLSALHNIDAAIGASVDLRVTLGIILENITRELKVDASAMLLMNPFTKSLEYTASRGFRARIIEGMRIRLGEGLAGQAAVLRRLVSRAEFGQVDLDLFVEEGFAVQYAVPLIAKGQVHGVLQVCHRSPMEPDTEWIGFLNTLAGQAAIAMDNSRLFEDLQRSNLELTLAYDATIQGWSQAMELRDKETQGHTMRVTELTMRLANELGLADTEAVHLRRGVLLHDIGKMGVPDAILLKPGPLTSEEWEIMRQHPVFAFEMLSSITYLHQALDVPYCHHEKWDGSGYPRGLKGEQIPLIARLFAVVDVFDAVTSDRPYRNAWNPEQAITYLREQSGKHFDPQVVEGFLRIMML